MIYNYVIKIYVKNQFFLKKIYKSLSKIQIVYTLAMNISICFSNDSTKIIKLRIATENKNRRLQMFFKTGVLKKFTRKHLRWSVF